MPGLLTCFTSNTDINSQLEALKFNYQGQLDPGEGLTPKMRRKKTPPFSNNLSSAEEMDSSYIFIGLKVSQILLCQAWRAKQPSPGSQPAVHTLRGSPGCSVRRTCFAVSMLLGRDPTPATWVTHILGVTRSRGTGGHGYLGTQPGSGLAGTAGTYPHCCWSILQPTAGIKHEGR